MCSVTPWTLVRLDSRQHDDVWKKLASQLPKFSDVFWDKEGPLLETSRVQLQNAQRELVQQSPMASQWCQYVTFMAIHVIIANISVTAKDRDNNNVPKEQQRAIATADESETRAWMKDWEEADQELLLLAWTLMDQLLDDVNVDWKSWCRLINIIDENLYVVTKQNPLIRYSRVLPTLTLEEYQTATQSLNPFLLLQSSASDGSNVPHLLKVKQAMQDKWDDHPIVLGMLLENPLKMSCEETCLNSATKLLSVHLKSSTLLALSSSRWTRSCLPTSAWEVSEEPMTTSQSQQPQVSLIALFDLWDKNDVMVTPFSGARPKNCRCYRCRYENDPAIVQQLSLRARKRLADYYLQNDETSRAQRLFRDILNDNNASTNDTPDKQQQMILQDVHHAMGAAYLQQGHFLKAQRYWNECVRQNPHVMSHAGIALQIEKQRGYGYLNDWSTEPPPMQLPIPDYQIIIPSLCFVTPQLVDKATCRQIIDWANNSSGSISSPWTSQRHYAVPTTDVAVHTVPKLLHWFVSWMKDTVQPLLARQFGTKDNQRFFCHDAFCVKYEPQAPNSHLPIHCDESTHSMVLSLNDDFEGGGTYFVDHNVTVLASSGSLVSFRGDSLRHGGNVVTSGVRYILAVFLYLDKNDGGLNATTMKKRALPIDIPKMESPTPKRNFSFGFDLST